MNLQKLTIGNGAGSIKSVRDVCEACKGPATRITVGSITKEPRSGNVGETYYFNARERWSMNSLGLPNIGIDAYGELWPEILARGHGEDKEVWASISPFSAEECAEMMDRLLSEGLDGVEVNGSCPNVWKHGQRKDIPALHPESAAEMFRITARYGDLGMVSFKLSPTRNVDILRGIADACREYGVEQLVCCNTMPDQDRLGEDGKPALAFRTSENDPQVKHTGGLAGAPVIEDSLFVVDVMRNFLPDIEILGSNGVYDGKGAKRYLDAGCAGVQSTTGYLQYGNKVFVEILTELLSA